MPTKLNVPLGEVVLTDKNGKQLEVGKISDIEAVCEQDHSTIKLKPDLSEMTFTIRIPLRSRLRFKWEAFKATRRAKRLINALYDKNKTHEFTISLKRGAENGN